MRSGFAISLSLFSALIVGCGSPSQPLTISLTAGQSSVVAGGTDQLTATVTGTGPGPLQWSVNGVSGGNSTYGTISASGLFAAPNVVPANPNVTVTVKSTAVFGSTASQSITLLITQPTVTSVVATCSPTSIQTGQTSQCSAQLNGIGSYSSAVNWSVNSISGGNSAVGTISSTGLYTAPLTIPIPNGSITVQASSQQSPSVGGSVSLGLSYPTPTVSGLTPQTINAGASNTVLTVQGSNFTAASTVELGSTAIPTIFVSARSLQATIPASYLNLAGQLYINVTNPAPGGGTTASSQVTVVPQLVAVTPNSSPVGGNISVQIVGISSSNSSTTGISFAQAGQSYSVTGGTISTSGGNTFLTVTVPSGLAPASVLTTLAAPAQISASVNSIAAPGALPFSVLPPTHAGSLSPTTATIGRTVQASFAGISTLFDSTATITSDDAGITFTGTTAPSNTVLLSNMAVGAGTVLGTHTITVISHSSVLTYPLQISAATSGSTITSVSPSTGSPAAPITIRGTGFGSGSGTSVTLAYSYGALQVQIPAKTVSATEIDTSLPPLFDPNTGTLYTGSVSLAVLVNGVPSGSYPVSLLPLPANNSSVGTATLSAIDAAIASASSAQSQLSSSSFLSSNQSQSVIAFYAAMLTQLNAFRSNVLAAAAGQTVHNDDGSILTPAAVDIFDRMIQTAKPVHGLGPALIHGLSPVRAVALPQSASALTDMQYAQAGQVCSSFDTSSQLTQFLHYATSLVCLSSAIPVLTPVAAPLCGEMKIADTTSTIVVSAAQAICDGQPLTLGAVAPMPTPIATYIGAPATVESPLGTFESNPTRSFQDLKSIVEAVFDALGGYGGVVQLLESNGATSSAAMDEVDNIRGGITELINDAILNVAPSWGQFTSATTPLTTATTTLETDPNSLVTVNGLSVTPGSMIGQTALTFDTSVFRMFDGSNNLTSYPLLVPGNFLPVSVGNVVVVVNPSTATVAPGATQQFTATVTGPLMNTAVTWSVNGVVGGNLTVGTISDQGLYTAPAAVPTPSTVSVSATSQADPFAIGSASVSVSIAPISVMVTPSSAVVSTNATQQFNATVQGLSNIAVSWSVNGIANGDPTVGMISNQGFYTAPAAVPVPAALSVTATSQVAPAISGSAIVTISSGVYSLVVSPAIAAIPVNLTQQFMATVQGTPDTAVIWSINGIVGGSPTVGTITSQGLYSAPAVIPNSSTVMVTATSQSDSSSSGTAQITITNGAYKFISFDYSAGSNTTLTGISKDGHIVGSSTAGSFIYDGVHFTSADYPNSYSSSPWSINDSGQVVGYYDSLSGRGGSQGFVYDGVSFTTIDYPGSTSLTNLYGINNSGQIVGTYSIANGNPQGLEYEAGNFVTIEYPGSGYTVPYRVNDIGLIVGIYYNPNGAGHAQGFVYSSGSFTNFDYPGDSATVPYGINNGGKIVGTYSLPGGGSHAFVYDGVTFTTTDFPGAVVTTPFDINDSGQMVGYFSLDSKTTHGFIASPVHP